jgi:hypothetical protein
VPPSLYYTSGRGSGGESKPLVMHCSDPRYQPHFQEFLEKGLGLPHYALIAVPGGPHCLTLSEHLPKFAWAGWRWVKVMEQVAKPPRIILIAHDDCRWYLSVGFVSGATSLRERQIADMKTARTELLERFGAPVELYYARLDGEHAVFESL